MKIKYVKEILLREILRVEIIIILKISLLNNKNSSQTFLKIVDGWIRTAIKKQTLYQNAVPKLLPPM